jgi:hypothetical protein
VIHPEGDKTRLKVFELTTATRQMVAQLVTATRCVFEEDKDAESYAVDLAEQNRMTYMGFAEPRRAQMG